MSIVVALFLAISLFVAGDMVKRSREGERAIRRYQRWNTRIRALGGRKA